jgi:prefoldin subunit 5
MAYKNISEVKKRIRTLYQNLSLLREDIELLEEKKKDSKAYEKLVRLGEEVIDKTGGATTKSIMDDVRG